MANFPTVASLLVLSTWILLTTNVSSFTQQRPLTTSTPSWVFIDRTYRSTQPLPSSTTLNIPTSSGTRTRSIRNRLFISSVPKDDGSGLSYAERSRPFRRDVFAWDLWVKHRATDRFVGNILDILDSGVVQSLIGEITLITFVASFVCAYNALFVTGFTDFSGILHVPIFASRFLPILKFPMEFFTLTTPALGLLLGT